MSSSAAVAESVSLRSVSSAAADTCALTVRNVASSRSTTTAWSARSNMPRTSRRKLDACVPAASPTAWTVVVHDWNTSVAAFWPRSAKAARSATTFCGVLMGLLECVIGARV